MAGQVTLYVCGHACVCALILCAALQNRSDDNTRQGQPPAAASVPFSYTALREEFRKWLLIYHVLGLLCTCVGVCWFDCIPQGLTYLAGKY